MAHSRYREEAWYLAKTEREGEERETKAEGKLELSDHVKEILDYGEDSDLCSGC